MHGLFQFKTEGGKSGRQRFRVGLDDEDVTGPYRTSWIRCGDPNLIADKADDLGICLVQNLFDLAKGFPDAF